MAPNNKMVTTKRQRNKDKSVAQVVKSIIQANIELKRYSLVTAPAAWTTGGLVVPLSQGLLPGDTVSGRTGFRIRPKRLEINLSITSTVAGVMGRVIIFQDTKNTGTLPGVAEVLDGSTYVSTYQVQNAQQKRFKILYDKVLTSQAVTAVVTTSTKVFKELRFSLKGNLDYNADTNIAAANGPGSIFILTIADAAVASYTYYSSLLYTDA